MKLQLTDYNDNTYKDTDGSCELCMYTGLLDHPEFQFTDSDGGVHDISGWGASQHQVQRECATGCTTQSSRRHGLGENETNPWDTALGAILWSASGQSSEEDLSWALADKTA